MCNSRSVNVSHSWLRYLIAIRNEYLKVLHCVAIAVVEMFVKGKVAIITGGASGIGLCYAKELLKNGLRGVTLADVDDAKGAEAVDAITQEFGPNRAVFAKTDVTNLQQFEDAFKKTISTFNNVDILINNAGILNDAIWEKQILINVNGTVHGCLLGMDNYLTKYKSGPEALIVNISSIAGIRPFPSIPVYTATKYSIIGLSKSLGCSESYETTKVRVVTICPGVTDTPLMQELQNKCLNERYVDLLVKALRTAKPLGQTPEDVANGLIKVIEEGANGSFWVIEVGETYEIDIPDMDRLKRK